MSDMVDTPLDRLADFDPMEVLPDRNFLVEDLKNFNPDITVAALPFVVSTFGAYGIDGEEGVQVLEDKVRERAQHATDGRFNKTDALYQPMAPPPGVWDYRCQNCRFFIPGAGDDGGGHCGIVGHEEDPFGGRSISPEAWCALWLPEDGEEWFTYLKNAAEGTADFDSEVPR